MSETIKFLSDIKNSYNLVKIIVVSVIAGLVIVCLGGMKMVVSHDEKAAGYVYIVDEGTAYAARRASNETQRDLEVINHVRRFHEIFFSMSPDSQSINNNLELALHMGDSSVKDYYDDLAEDNFFKRLIQTNSSEQIVVDSVKVNIRDYPYTAITYAHLYMVRESSITVYDFRSSCRLTEATRTEVNPNGLLIERFSVDRNEKIETRRRK